MDTPSKDAKPENAVTLSSSLLKDFFDQHFDQLNQTKDAFITRKELTAALHSHSVKGTDAKIAEAVLENFHDMELQSNDEFGTENNGITKDDVRLFEQNRKLKPENALAVKIETSLNADEHNPEKFINLVSLYKAQMDDDGNGTLGKAELSQYVKSSQDRPAAVGAAKVLLDHFDSINKIGSPNTFKGLLAGDSNPRALGQQELATLAQILGPEKVFRKQLSSAVSAEASGAGSELGKQGRLITGRGDSTEAAVIGTALEIFGTIQAGNAQKKAASRYELLLDDFQQRKAMVDSWKFFK